ncbi:MAG: SH3 domain-containing protein [Ruminococcus sp.]|uniref:SH3 domain-containing protein n=1 Tax=Ruminococcus sp. TaxID=41978 RepID=UPI0025F75C37|nr:SH3 domain-containing protein [Ruminococcus sp.]MBO4867909.1 SH3 domain-containing protein [Ruminococcus sp.]
MCKNFRILIVTALAAASLAGCGHVGEGKGSDTEPIFTSTSAMEKRTVHTTRTAAIAVGDVDADDEDANGGYTTTTTIIGSLENDQLFDEVDEDIRATQRTEAKTYYSVPEHNGTTGAVMTVSAEKTTTTANGTISIEDPTTRPTTKSTTAATTTTKIVPNKLFRMESAMEYDSKRKYTVTSDTTYLNLRYGPSKEYDIRTTIPDGTIITGYGETVGPDGNVWVATLYNGTSGWVMRELLSY